MARRIGPHKTRRATRSTPPAPEPQEPPRPPDAPAPIEGPDPVPHLLFGIPFHNVDEDRVLEWIAARVRSGRPCQIVTSNLDFVRLASRDPEMHRIQLEADLVVADGMPLVWFSRLFGPALQTRVAGSDLVPRLAAMARDRGLSLYAVGAAPGVAGEALSVLQERYEGLQVAGWHSPPMAPLLQMDHEAIVKRIGETRPDILLVAFGAPKQDKWIHLQLAQWNIPVAIGVGGSLDFITGNQVRAPRWIQRIGLEWFWRMAGQPRRLFGRYLSDFVFLVSMLFRVALVRMLPSGTPPAAAGTAASGNPGAARRTLPSLRREGEAEEFIRSEDDPDRDGPLVIDLSGHRWLNSLELGALAELARSRRRRGFRLYVTGTAPRVSRLLRLFRLDRYLELRPSATDLERELEQMESSGSVPGLRFNRATHRLQVVLPEEFEKNIVTRMKEEFDRHWSSDDIREIVIDAGGMRYIDSAGAQFLSETRRRIKKKSGRSMWLRGFPESLLRTMEREGLESIRIDRRKRFRETAPAENTKGGSKAR